MSDPKVGEYKNAERLGFAALTTGYSINTKCLKLGPEDQRAMMGVVAKQYSLASDHFNKAASLRKKSYNETPAHKRDHGHLYRVKKIRQLGAACDDHACAVSQWIEDWAPTRTKVVETMKRAPFSQISYFVDTYPDLLTPPTLEEQELFEMWCHSGGLPPPALYSIITKDRLYELLREYLLKLQQKIVNLLNSRIADTVFNNESGASLTAKDANTFKYRVSREFRLYSDHVHLLTKKEYGAIISFQNDCKKHACDFGQLTVLREDFEKHCEKIIKL